MKKAVTTLLMLTAFNYLYHAKSKDMINIQEEIWKDIPSFEGLYQASNQGLVRSLPRNTTAGRVLKFHTAHNRYLRVMLSKDNIQTTFPVHRLICMAFLENPDKPSNISFACKYGTPSHGFKWKYA